MAKKNDRQFEEKMKRLEEIVSALESPDVSLEEGLALYREGALCSRFCREKLEKARHELQIWQNGEATPVKQADIADCAEEEEDDA